jgi:hypothetical protein
LTRFTTPTARKKHQCSGCHGTINPGEEYERLEGLFDARWSTWKQCQHCVPIWENIAGGFRRIEYILKHFEKFETWWEDPRVMKIEGVKKANDGFSPYGCYYEAILIPNVGMVSVDQTELDNGGYC